MSIPVYAIAALLMTTGVALFVAAPLYGALRQEPRRAARDETAEHLEHEYRQAIQAIRELEFDRHMNKISRQDFEETRQRLKSRALHLLAQLEKAESQRNARSQTTVPAEDNPRESFVDLESSSTGTRDDVRGHTEVLRSNQRPAATENGSHFNESKRHQLPVAVLSEEWRLVPADRHPLATHGGLSLQPSTAPKKPAS